jgi:diguanylate cyclase (GGDEF)-like protein
MNRSRNTFVELAIRMIGFGVLIGTVFPFFMLMIGTPPEIVINGLFFASCIIAGVIVGVVNILISKVTVQRKLTLLTAKMDEVKDSIITMSANGNIGECSPEHCCIPVETDDEFGRSAQAFNELIESFSNSLRMLDGIKSYTAIFSGQLDLHALADYALERVMNETGADAGAILYDQDGEIGVLHSFGIRDAARLASDPHILETFTKGVPCALEHPADVIVESTLTQFHPKAVTIEPVLFKSVPIAVILLAKSEAFKAGYKKQLSIFTQSLAVAMHNALEHEQLQKLAALDPLTGVLNRRFGLVRLREEYARSVRRGVPLGVLMFDIDHFKQVNDTYGHIVGDRVLKDIAALIRQGIREGDVLMRYGGEEFLVILPGASREDVLSVAERARYLVRDHKTRYGDNLIGVTISGGGDSMPESAVTSELTLISNADEALYLSKDNGRDRITLR